MFVLVMISNTGNTSHWAQFDTLAECETHISGLRATVPQYTFACMPINVKSQAETQKDFQQALDVAVGMMSSMRKQMDEFSKNN